jgi:hypothetical protein
MAAAASLLDHTCVRARAWAFGFVTRNTGSVTKAAIVDQERLV